MRTSKYIYILLILVLSILVIQPVNTYAYSKQNTTIKHSLADKNKKSNKKNSKKTANAWQANCDSILGNPENKDSFAWLLQEILNIVKYVGPFLLLVLSSVDFAKVIIQSDEESMHKAQKKLLVRIVLVLVLFFIPDLVMVLLGIFGITDDPTCGIE
ncbi:MAG: hypothetical protein IJF92_04025 [Bacilli bacterium]|nr:hypothetical protein [Bacilli bacterium]